PQHAELLDGRRPIDVGRDQERSEAFPLEVAPELRDARRLAGALETQHHDHRWRAGRHRQSVRGASEKLGKLPVHDLHDLLAWREALKDILSDRLLADALHEGPDDLEVHVRFEQRDADLPECFLNVLLGEAARTPEAVEDRLEALRQGFEHGWSSRNPVGKSRKALKATGHPRRRQGDTSAATGRSRAAVGAGAVRPRYADRPSRVDGPGCSARPAPP